MSEFAELLGVSAGALGNYIRGDREPSFDFLVQVRRVTGADINWLLTGEGSAATASKSTDSPRIDAAIMASVTRIVSEAHQRAGITLPPASLVRETAAIYNDILERVDDPSDHDEMRALLPWAEKRLGKRLSEAVKKPGSGKRSA